ncbi:MAG: peptidoglycan editing factor PgeF [Lachnospiraceae bacterium]
MNIENVTLNRIQEWERTMELEQLGDVPVFVYPKFKEIKGINHCFTTRHGGVSEGIYSSMSFKEDGDDTYEHVRENYRIISAALGVDVNKMVRSQINHGIAVHVVGEEDFGSGTTEKSRIINYDGLVTNKKGVTLVATFADCVPLYFIDEKHNAIGLAHSGWKGTAHKIALEMIDAMHREYQTERKDLLVAIGPCICADCYEVSDDLYDIFKKDFLGKIETATKISFEHIMSKGKVEGKYQLDLRKANLQTLLSAGLTLEQIEVSDICSCCNPELIFSHRFTKGKRGVSAAMLGIV